MYRIATPGPALELAHGLFVSANRTVCGAAHPRRAASGPSNPSAVFALQPIPLPDPLPLQLNESKKEANTGWQKCRLAQIALGHHAIGSRASLGFPPFPALLRQRRRLDYRQGQGIEQALLRLAPAPSIRHCPAARRRRASGMTENIRKQEQI